MAVKRKSDAALKELRAFGLTDSHESNGELRKMG